MEKFRERRAREFALAQEREAQRQAALQELELRAHATAEAWWTLLSRAQVEELFRTAPEAATLSALARQLDQYLAGPMSPAQTRLTAVLALELDTAARSGELVELRTTDLGEDNAAVYVERRPQGGGTGQGQWVETSALTRAALERWLDVRKDLVQRAHGTSKLWVSLWMNHDGVLDDDGHTTIRPPGMPLEENGLVTSYRVGRLRYDGLPQLLPLKLEALRRAVETERRRATAATPSP